MAQTMLCNRDEKCSRGTTQIPAILAGALLTPPALAGFSNYPMITEEAELTLMHKPSRRAQPLIFTRDPSQRFYNF